MSRNKDEGMEKRNVVQVRRTPESELKADDKEFDKKAEAMFKPVKKD